MAQHGLRIGRRATLAAAMITISALNIYPVKSCAGVAVSRCQLTPTGFAHDREWMVVRADGRFVTQRERPQLALISPALDAHALTLHAPGMDPLSVPFAPRGAKVEVQCWNDLCAAFDVGDAAAQWLSAHLGTAHRLVRFDPSHRRPSDSAWTDGVEAFNQFTDGFPWLIISESSLADLNTRLPAPLPMNRFRPNIVIAGVAPYDEDRLLELTAGPVRWRLVKACTRCAITTTDQATGVRDGDEPLRTLRGYRFDRRLQGIAFGQNAIAITGIRSDITVGAELRATWRD